MHAPSFVCQLTGHFFTCQKLVTDDDDDDLSKSLHCFFCHCFQPVTATPWCV